MNLTSVNRLASYLRLETTQQSQDNGLLQLLVDAANDAITKAVQRNVLSAQYSETRDGTGTDTLVLANYPVTAVGSLVVCNAALIASTDFVFTATSIKLLKWARFPRGVANIAVQYTAGLGALPNDLCHAATKWAGLRYKETNRLGEKSKVLEGNTVDFDLSEMPEDVANIVSRYQSKIPLIASPIAGVA